MSIEVKKFEIHYTAIVELPPKEIDRWNRLLTEDGFSYDEENLKPLDIAAVYTVVFPDGHSIDVKVCTNEKDEPIFSEAVLFNSEGQQINFTEPQYELDGIWNLEGDNNTYTVDIRRRGEK